MPNPDPLAPLLRRLFSLSGVLASSAFLLVHVAINGRALSGDPAFSRAVRAVQALPGLALIEWGLVLLPLALHAVVGAWLVVARRPLFRSSPYPRAVGVAVRVTGLGAFAFLAMHLPELRFRAGAVHLDGGQLSTALAADLSATWHGIPWRGLIYLTGAGCIAFHWAAGLWGFFARARRGGGAGELRWTARGAGVLGVVTWLLLANIVVYHATGSRLLGGAAIEDPARQPCPAAPAISGK